jgi:hypothetical protein
MPVLQTTAYATAVSNHGNYALVDQLYDSSRLEFVSTLTGDGDGDLLRRLPANHCQLFRQFSRELRV